MPYFNAVISAVQSVTMKVVVEADDEREALQLIATGDFDDVLDETDHQILRVDEINLY